MSATDLGWVPVGSGRLAVRGRPKLARIPHLPAERCTHVATILSELEGAQEIGQRVQRAGMHWFWLPLANGALPSGSAEQMVLDMVPHLAGALEVGGSLLIHCSAGIHRTGMIAYALLRFCGLSAAEACDTLVRARSLTAGGMGEARRAWVDRLFS